MAYTNLPSIVDAPTITDIPSGIVDVPSITDVPAKHSSGGGSHLLDGSSNILAVTAGVDQLTNA
jgi:hypothetical protein